MNSDDINPGSAEDVDDSLNRALDNAYSWLKGDQIRPRRSSSEAFSVTQLLDLPDRGRHIIGFCIGHGLDTDGCPVADGNIANHDPAGLFSSDG